jgi:hypothetical protein
MLTNAKIKIFGNLILYVVLDGCETSYLSLMKEQNLRVFDNRVVRIIFEYMRGLAVLILRFRLES